MKRLLLLLVVVVYHQQLPAQTANPQQYIYLFTVAKDGAGDYKFIQDAIDAMRAYPLGTIRLYIKNGVYNEKIALPANNTDVVFIGESVEKTIITFSDYSGRGKLTTFDSYTAKISGNRFRAENISFVNAAGRIGQAVALYVDAHKAVFKNSRFLGNQDTIFAAGENACQFLKIVILKAPMILFLALPPQCLSSVPLRQNPIHLLPRPAPHQAAGLGMFSLIVPSLPIQGLQGYSWAGPVLHMQKRFLSAAHYLLQLLQQAGITGTIPTMKKPCCTPNTNPGAKVRYLVNACHGRSNSPTWRHVITPPILYFPTVVPVARQCPNGGCKMGRSLLPGRLPDKLQLQNACVI